MLLSLRHLTTPRILGNQALDLLVLSLGKRSPFPMSE